MVCCKSRAAGEKWASLWGNHNNTIKYIITDNGRHTVCLTHFTGNINSNGEKEHWNLVKWGTERKRWAERKKQNKRQREMVTADESNTVSECLSLPVESSCRPTSNDSLSVWDLDVFKQARYCEATKLPRWKLSHALDLVTLLSIWVIFESINRNMTLFCFDQFWARSHHRTEGMPQEDGVTVQQCLVSTALCCLLGQFTHKKHTKTCQNKLSRAKKW